jgi:PAS domain S-box-containing protein
MKKTLIVDDNEQNLILLQTILKGQGYDVLMAGNGVEALELARCTPPDIIIADILMPVMDGFALCRSWKKDENLKDIPLVFYTATYTDPKDKEFALSLGAARFIVKPQDPEVLVALIRQVIEACESGPPLAPAQPAPVETDYYKLYSESLVRKLEKKMLKLEQLNRMLDKSEKRYRLLAENVQDVIFVLDLDLNYTYVSPSVKVLRGYEPEEVLEQQACETLTPESWDLAVKTVSEAMELEKAGHEDLQRSRTLELEMRRKNGTTVWTEVSVSFIRDEDGRPAGILGVTRDITGRKQTEAEKMKLQAQLVQTQKMESIGRLAGGVAHDFNNMLAIILGYAELALNKVNPSDSLHADLEEIRMAAGRSADLTRQLLAFARKQTISPEALDLNGTVEEMLKMLRRLLGEDINLSWLPGKRLWQVMMDPSQLDQILANLCVNARDAISGVGKMTIETGNRIFDADYCTTHPGSVQGEYVMLNVSDNGCGMDKETQQQIFEPFFTTKETGKGTGLGLATVYGIVKQNNGFINVYSEPEQGTTFTIYLPRLIGMATQIQSEESAEPAAHGNETILLVEDDTVILKMTTIMIENLGYTVVAASTPGEAIRLSEKHSGQIQLLVTDVIMPDMNGRDLARNLSSRYPSLRSLYMSGYTANVIAHHGVLDPGVDFIQKPFSMRDLAAKVRKVLGNVNA